MKDIFCGPVFEFIKNESINNEHGWDGNRGIIDCSQESLFNFCVQGSNFIRNFLVEQKPFNIVETGTNYGSFSYILYETLENFCLHTCDINSMNESERCINFINSYYNSDKVRYKNVDGLLMLKELKTQGIKVDLAWLDSAHMYDHLLSELYLTKELEAKFIMVDDIYFIKPLQNAVFDFLRQDNGYKLYGFSNIRAGIGSIMILEKE